MPTYEYRCAKCGQHLEVFQSFSETPLTRHEVCGGKLAKVLSPAGIVLKGSGFYKTDSRDSSRSTKRRADTTDKADTAAGSASGSPDGASSAAPKDASKDAPKDAAKKRPSEGSAA